MLKNFLNFLTYTHGRQGKYIEYQNPSLVRSVNVSSDKPALHKEYYCQFGKKKKKKKKGKNAYVSQGQNRVDKNKQTNKQKKQQKTKLQNIRIIQKCY